jgi:predicted transcriptional regulator
MSSLVNREDLWPAFGRSSVHQLRSLLVQQGKNRSITIGNADERCLTTNLKKADAWAPRWLKVFARVQLVWFAVFTRHIRSLKPLCTALTLRHTALYHQASCLISTEQGIMPRKVADVTETELAILDVLWNCGQSTVREIAATLYNRHTPSLHMTVKSLLERLETKGYVECDKTAFAHLFSAKTTREAYVGQQLKQLADSHFEGALGPMLSTLIDGIKLSRQDRETIRKIIDRIK